MKANRTIAIAACVLIAVSMLASGCICCNFGNTGPSPTPEATPVPAVTITALPTGMPSGTIHATAAPTSGQPGIRSAELSGWSTDSDTYARGDTAKGGVDVENTGNATIDQIDFKVVISRTVLFIPYTKEFSYSATGLDIKPGETKRVEFSQEIPAEYGGVSTAGNYKLEVTATVDGKAVGTFSKNIKVT